MSFLLDTDICSTHVNMTTPLVGRIEGLKVAHLLKGTDMANVIEGTIRGRTIELQADPGLADGQRVQVLIAPFPGNTGASPEEEGTIHTPLSDPVLMDLIARIRRARHPLPSGPTGPCRPSAAGMLADDLEFDAIMDEIERARRSDFGREVSE